LKEVVRISYTGLATGLDFQRIAILMANFPISVAVILSILGIFGKSCASTAADRDFVFWGTPSQWRTQTWCL